MLPPLEEKKLPSLGGEQSLPDISALTPKKEKPELPTRNARPQVRNQQPVAMPTIEEPRTPEPPSVEIPQQPEVTYVQPQPYQEPQPQYQPQPEVVPVAPAPPVQPVAPAPEHTPVEYIDKENAKIIPYGGEKSKGKKKTLKANDIDKRTNLLVASKIKTIGFWGFISIMSIIGIFSTFFPSNVLTPADVNSIVNNTTRNIGFPIERGRSFAEAYIHEFLTIDPEDPTRAQVLNDFHTGGAPLAAHTQRVTSARVNQRVVIPPQTFNYEILTPYSAHFQITTYVSDLNGETFGNNNPAGRWITFGVNVFHDMETGLVAISPNSPILMPNPVVMPTGNMPREQAFGTGVRSDEKSRTTQPLIEGFLNAYARVSLDSHESVLQFIITNPPQSLIAGFDGSVVVDRIDRWDVFYREGNEFTGDLVVTWEDTRSEGEYSALFTARYIVGILEMPDGSYRINRFMPYMFRQE